MMAAAPLKRSNFSRLSVVSRMLVNFPAVWSLKLLDDRPVGDDFGTHAFGIPQGDQLHHRAVLGFSKLRLLKPFQSLSLG
jgi:hypothetical protein